MTPNKIEFLRNLFGLSFAAAAMPISIFIITPVIVRRLGIEDFATYSLVFTIAGGLIALTQGTSVTLIKELSSKLPEGNSRFRLIERQALKAAAVCLPYLWITQKWDILAGGLFVASAYYSTVLVGLGRLSFQGFVVGSMNLAFAAIVVLAQNQIQNINSIFFIYSCIFLTGNATMRIDIGRIIPQHEKKKSELQWGELRALTFIEGIGILTSMMDRLVASVTLPNVAFGHYSLGATLGKSPSLVRAPLLRYIVPYVLSSHGEIREKVRRATLLLALTTIPFSVACSFFMNEIVTLWIGSLPSEVSNVARLLITGVGYHTLAAPVYYALVQRGDLKFLQGWSFFSLILLTISLVLLGRELGSVGIAASWMILMAVTSVFMSLRFARSAKQSNRDIAILMMANLLASAPLLPFAFDF